MNTQQHDDDVLWEIAKSRARFKKHLVSYVLVCGMLWGIWFMTGRHNGNGYYNGYASVFPWPCWVMFWWGICLAWSFVNAYLVNKKDIIEEEYRKLKNQQ